jgi:hypothetical protein
MAPTLSHMTDDRKGALALITSATGGVITMILHPSGHELLAPGQFAHVAFLNGVVHALAVASSPVAFVGALALWRRLESPSRLALAALVVYGFALMAVTSAAAVSGFVAPGVAREILEAGPQEVAVWRALLQYSGQLNQAFALIFVLASCTAIVLWSAAIIGERALARGLGAYGVVLGPVLMIAVLSGHLRLGVHGFGIVIFSQSIWFMTAGILLWHLDGAVAADKGTSTERSA